MRAFWRDPYLWVHLAGLAALPLFLELCVLGLAIDDPLLPVWLEVLLVAGVGIGPVLWMQWQRPFYIFSLVAVSLKPQELTEDQRRLLTLFRSQRTRFLAAAVALLMVFGVRWLYNGAAIAADVAPVLPGGRVTGLLLAAIAFLGGNLFLQVPVSVAGVMLTPQSTFEATAPCPIEQIQQSFTLLGLPIQRILPPVLVPEAVAVAPASAPAPPLEPRASEAASVEPPLKETPLEEVPLEEVKVEAIVPQLESELEKLEEEVDPP